eukprot:3338875-Heterocapsa_arctica.AAC.1
MWKDQFASMKDAVPESAKLAWDAAIAEAFDQPNSNGAPRALAAAKRIMSKALRTINGKQGGPRG